jgi:hypothetical protein
MNQYSIAITNALEQYGARTTGTLERRRQRLERFVQMKNASYAKAIARENQPATPPKCPICIATDNYEDLEDLMYVMSERLTQLRESQQGGLNLLCEAIENGHVQTTRGSTNAVSSLH